MPPRSCRLRLRLEPYGRENQSGEGDSELIGFRGPWRSDVPAFGADGVVGGGPDRDAGCEWAVPLFPHSGYFHAACAARLTNLSAALMTPWRAVSAVRVVGDGRPTTRPFTYG